MAALFGHGNPLATPAGQLIGKICVKLVCKKASTHCYQSHIQHFILTSSGLCSRRCSVVLASFSSPHGS
jgi:hypothetical protein